MPKRFITTIGVGGGELVNKHKQIRFLSTVCECVGGCVFVGVSVYFAAASGCASVFSGCG